MNSSVVLKQSIINKRPVYQSHNARPTQAFNDSSNKKKTVNQSIDLKRQLPNLSSQRNEAQTKFVLKMSKPTNNRGDLRRNAAHSISSVDPRAKRTPRGSPGISSLAADMANQSIDEQPLKPQKISFPMQPREALIHL